MEGLECSEAKLSELERTMRVDAEFFNPHGLQAVKKLQEINSVSLASLVGVSDGNHFSISDEFVDDGVPYFRGQDVTGSFFMEQACPVTIPPLVFDQKHMRRSHLAKGDVLLSIVGTIGESSLFSSSQPATCSCKLAILRPHSISSEFLAVFLKAEHGRLQVVRQTRGAIQGSLLLEDMDQILVPRFSKDFEGGIVKAVRSAQATLEKSASCQAQAEQTLLQALGLKNWQPPEPLTYTRRASETLAAERFDSEYFAPRVAQLLSKLNADGLTIRDVAPARHDSFDAAKHTGETFDYIEISGLRSDGTATSEATPTDEAPSRASQLVSKGDVITSTVRPIRRLSAMIAPEQDGHVCSSGFVVLNPASIAPEVLLTYLRMPAICELMDLHTSASLYPAISERDLLKLPIPKITDKVATQIITQVRQAHAARQQAQALLAKAKRAVEVAIEEGEEKALKFLAA